MGFFYVRFWLSRYSVGDKKNLDFSVLGMRIDAILIDSSNTLRKHIASCPWIELMLKGNQNIGKHWEEKSMWKSEKIIIKGQNRNNTVLI
jgi:hypothetical protein